MKNLIKAAVAVAALATVTLTPAWASAANLPGGAASATAGSTTKTVRCGSDKVACEQKRQTYLGNNTVTEVQYQPPSPTGRGGNYFYFNYTPK